MGKAAPDAVPKAAPDRKKQRRQTGFEVTLDPQAVASYVRQRQTLQVNPQDPLWRRKRVATVQRLNMEAARRLAANEVLMTEQEGYLETEDGRPTYKVRQEEIIGDLDLESRSKLLNLKLSFGPYKVEYTDNGKHMLVAGKKGGLAVLDCATWVATAETNVRETVRAVKFLNDSQRFATAQRKYIHVYDEYATEVHVLREQQRVTDLAYLPFHWLLAGIGEDGNLSWTDVSDGRLVRLTKDKMLRNGCIAADPFSAVLAVGNSKGNASLWTPNEESPVVAWRAHCGTIRKMVFLDRRHRLVTAGEDFKVRIWDMRRLERALRTIDHHRGVPADLAVSGNGLLATSSAGVVQVWRDPMSTRPIPYLRYRPPSAPESFKFRPYEDFLTVGHEEGVSTMVVPGCAVANFDTYAANPYETPKARSERTIKSLLDKLPPETISVDELFGG